MPASHAALSRPFALSRLGYYADFAIAPMGAFGLVAGYLAGKSSLLALVGLMMVGALGWELAEYLIHRFVFHGSLRRLHNVHHRRPQAYIGIGSWGTFAAFGLAWALLALCFGAPAAHAVIAGVLLGYLFYIAIHDRMHHGDRARYGRYLRLMHALHAGHHRGGNANFGVSSPLFDFVFRTYRPQRIMP